MMKTINKNIGIKYLTEEQRKRIIEYLIKNNDMLLNKERGKVEIITHYIKLKYEQPIVSAPRYKGRE